MLVSVSVAEGEDRSRGAPGVSLCEDRPSFASTAALTALAASAQSGCCRVTLRSLESTVVGGTQRRQGKGTDLRRGVESEREE